VLGSPIDSTKVGAAFAFVNPPPPITTNPASGVTGTTATLNGVVHPGASSFVRFQFGSSPAYGSQSSRLGLPASATAIGVAATLTGLTPGATYHFRLITENSAGTNFGADQAFTTTSAPGGTATPISTPTAVVPVLSAVKQSNRTWREGSKLARISAKSKPRPPVGTKFSFKLNEQANVVLAFTQPAAGRKVNGKCVAQTNQNRRKHACKRTLTRGTLSLAARAGSRKVAFQGVISRSRKLKPGTYTLVLTASSSGLRSSPKSLSFTIVK
jgi:hypothetical protein